MQKRVIMSANLTYEQRCELSVLKKLGYAVKDIAISLGFHTTTIYRELKRNTGQNGYQAKQAHRMTTERSKKAGESGRIDPSVLKLVDVRIRENWSPEQISGRFRSENIFISHETIYQYIYEDKKKGGDLHTYLRCQKKRRKRYGTAKKDKRGQIKNRVGIEERPEIVEQKMRKGDWEGDLVIGKNHSGALVTLVDRKTKKTLIGKTLTKEADAVRKVVCKLLKGEKVHTVTFDNGKEFAGHEKMAETLKCKVFFAHPYCSWERGLNENTNGLIRQYFPKDSCFKSITMRAIKLVENALNNRPRKILGYLTPNEVYSG